MTTDLTTEQGVITLMRSSTTEQEWDFNCEKVKQANGNKYPAFWFTACILSGLLNEVQPKWC